MLTKWYLDSVSESGDLFFGYATSLTWKVLKLNQVATLSCVDGEIKEESGKARKDGFPEKVGSRILWNCPRLNVSGQWSGLTSSIDRTLFESAEGAVRWQCLQPGSRVSLNESGMSPISGFGYAERIEMTLKPWKLPIDELLWGRFVSESDQIVWIEWRGSYPQILIFHNGVQTSGGSVSDTAIETGTGLTLELSDRLVLREGQIGATGLASLSAQLRILPSGVLKIHERKWRSRGVLRKDGAVIDRGWVIHEIVSF